MLFLGTRIPYWKYYFTILWYEHIFAYIGQYVEHKIAYIIVAT